MSRNGNIGNAFSSFSPTVKNTLPNFGGPTLKLQIKAKLSDLIKAGLHKHGEQLFGGRMCRFFSTELLRKVLIGKVKADFPTLKSHCGLSNCRGQCYYYHHFRQC
jgi:hypothetical protein